MSEKISEQIPTPNNDQEREKRGFLQSFKNYIDKNSKAIGLFVAFSFLGSCQPQKIEDSKKEEDKNKEISDITKDEKSNWEYEGTHHTLFKKEEEKIKINPWVIINPLQMEFSEEIITESECEIDIPYSYARLFNSSEALDPEDYEKVAGYLEQKIRQEFAEKLVGLDVSKKVHESQQGENKDELNNLRVTDIRVLGTTSPEGPQEEGAQTMAPGKVDEENIELGQERARKTFNTAKKKLEEMGVDMSNIKMEGNIESVELQFSDQELRELSSLASDQEGMDDMEKVFNLIVAYNDGEVKDEEKIKKLDEILAGKRTAKLEIDYEGKQKKVILIPIPLLPIPFRVRKLNEEEEEDSEEEPEGNGTENGSEDTSDWDDIPENVFTTDLPDKDTTEYEIMEEETIANDLYVYFDNKEAGEKGLDYRKMADHMEQNYDKFNDNSERENYLTNKILDGWQIHDKECRKEAGVSEDSLEEGLDYKNQESQIKWAKMHARAMLEIVEEKINSGNNKDYSEILSQKSAQLVQRKTIRENS